MSYHHDIVESCVIITTSSYVSVNVLSKNLISIEDMKTSCSKCIMNHRLRNNFMYWIILKAVEFLAKLFVFISYMILIMKDDEAFPRNYLLESLDDFWQ